MWPRRLYRALYAVDTRAEALGRVLRGRLGLGLPPRIVAYRGYGTRARVTLRARVLEDRRIPRPRSDASLVDAAVVSWKRFATRAIPGRELFVRWGADTWHVRTDLEGFATLVVAPRDAAPGWHEVAFELADGEGAGLTAVAPVVVVGKTAEVGIISDVDDTVIATGVPNPLLRARALFLTESVNRLAFDGVAALYHALARGASGTQQNPIYYVSSTPWNLYDHVNALLEHVGMPEGPILLRDWGLSPEGFAPGGGHGHKRALLREILAAHPDLAFVLFGDDGQEDARHYLAIAEEHPGRIRAVYVRQVRTEASAALQAAATGFRALGVPMVRFSNSRDVTEHALALGLISPAQLPVR